MPFESVSSKNNRMVPGSIPGVGANLIRRYSVMETRNIVNVESGDRYPLMAPYLGLVRSVSVGVLIKLWSNTRGFDSP
jgi:hypothetical protein